jgi:hypothetical protein
MGKHIEYSKARPLMLVTSMKVGLAQLGNLFFALPWLLPVKLNFDRLVKMSILAQLHALAPPGMQKRVVQ